MTNPFVRPHTLSDWLRSSLCWTGACLGGLLLAWLLLFILPAPLAQLVGSCLLPGGLLAHVLIWRYAITGGRAIIHQDQEQHDFTPLRLAANLWLVALTLFQLACLLAPVILLGLLIYSAGNEPPAPPSSEPFFG